VATEGRPAYDRFVRRKLLFLAGCLLALVAVAFLALAVGPVRLAPATVLEALMGRADGTAGSIVRGVRLPAVLAAIVAGGGLSVAGAAMQTVLRNPLGSPFTLGISQAAAFGAAFAIVVLGTDSLSSVGGPHVVTLSAFGWSLLSTAAILALVSYARVSPETLILSGVALGSLFTAALSFLQYVGTDVEVAAIVYWTFGDVGRATRTDLVAMAAVTVAGVVYFVANGRRYAVLNAGDEVATSLGIDVDRLRIRGMVVASLVTAAVVSFVGIVGFVGLVVPHVVRKLVGGDERFLLPASALVGATLLLAADAVARTVLAPVVLPVGILTAFLGAPLFLYLVVTRRDHW